MIPVWISSFTGLSEIALFLVMVGGLALLSMHLCRNIINSLITDSTQEWLTAFMIAAILLIMPTLQDSYGQREHLLLIFALPYILLLVVEINGAAHSRKLSLGLALYAAIGFAIKPHFILIFAAAECARAISKRNVWALFRPEAWIISIIFLSYHGYLLIAHHDYMLTIWPMVMASYAGYQISTEIIIMTAILYASPTYFILAYAINRRVSGGVLLPLSAIIIASAVVFIAPMTNYSYQALPLLTLQCLLGAIVYLKLNKPVHGFIWVAVWVILSIGDLSATSAQQKKDIAEKIGFHAKNQTVAVISSSTNGGFPAVNYGHAYWGLSLPYMIHLPLAYAENRGSDKEPVYRTLPEMNDNERFFTERTLEDLEKKPALIIFDERENKQAFINMRFNFINYFLAQERFRALWKDYRYIGTLHDFAFYKYEPAAKP
jgi:hypothetical protein